MILLGEEVNVVVEKKRIKNIYFRINENNEIYVTCPKYVSNIEINKMLEKNRDSLEKMYKKQVKKNERNEKVLAFVNKYFPVKQKKKKNESKDKA